MLKERIVMGKGFKKLMAMAAVSAMTLTTLAGCGSSHLVNFFHLFFPFSD